MTPEERTAWLAKRHRNVSSTESSALFGLNPYLTAFELAVAKKAAVPEDWEGDTRMGWGKRLQDAIALGVSFDYGVITAEMPDYLERPSTRIGSSFDFQIVCNADGPAHDPALQELFVARGPGILEVKNVDSLEYKNKWTEEAPPHIEIQLQHQLEVAGYQWGVIAALVGGNRAEIIIRERDEAVGKAIVTKVRQFWAELDAGKMPPLVMPEDAGALIKLYGFADPDLLYDGRENEALAHLCGQYTAAGITEKMAKEVKEVAHARILEIIGRAEKALVQGYSVSAGMVAAAEIRYTRAPYRNFRITAKKEKVDGQNKAP